MSAGVYQTVRIRGVVRIIDALSTQERMIIHLVCKHTVSIDRQTLLSSSTLSKDLERASNRLQAHDALVEWPCPHCPDETPQEQARFRIEKLTPQQLWKEAGEP